MNNHSSELSRLLDELDHLNLSKISIVFAKKDNFTRFKGKPEVEILISALNDNDGSVQRFAADALGIIGDERAVEPLISALKGYNNYLRRSAAEALGKLGDPRAVELLITMLKDDDKYVRRDAARALGDLGDSRAIESLIAALNDGISDVRKNAAKALGNLGDSRAVKPLTSMLKDKDNDICAYEIKEAISKIACKGNHVFDKHCVCKVCGLQIHDFKKSRDYVETCTRCGEEEYDTSTNPVTWS